MDAILHCAKCAWAWFRRSGAPKRCPNPACRTRLWDGRHARGRKVVTDAQLDAQAAAILERYTLPPGVHEESEALAMLRRARERAS